MPPNETLGQGLKIEELCQDDITNTLVFFVNGEFENMFPSFLNINSDYIWWLYVEYYCFILFITKGGLILEDILTLVPQVANKGSNYQIIRLSRKFV